MTQDECGNLLLREWSAWAAEQNLLGFPSRSPTERAREGGMERGAHSPEGPMPPEISKTDRAVTRLSNRNKLAGKAIKKYYLHGVSVFRLSAELGLSRRKAEDMLYMAQRLVRLEREALNAA